MRGHPTAFLAWRVFRSAGGSSVPPCSVERVATVHTSLASTRIRCCRRKRSGWSPSWRRSRPGKRPRRRRCGASGNKWSGRLRTNGWRSMPARRRLGGISGGGSKLHEVRGNGRDRLRARGGSDSGERERPQRGVRAGGTSLGQGSRPPRNYPAFRLRQLRACGQSRHRLLLDQAAPVPQKAP